MIGVQELKKGTTFEYEGSIYKVLDYEHIKMARGGATIKVKARDLRTGTIRNASFNSGKSVQDISLDHATVQYLYHEEHLYHFMDLETYEQPVLNAELLGSAVYYLVPEMTLKILSFEGEAIDIELPTTVDMEVTYTEPGFAGNTSTGVTKEAVFETDLKVQVPLFIEIGDMIRIDTRTDSYVTRV